MASTIEDFLLAHLNIHVTGPSFPHRDAPLQTYIPTHRSYTRTQSLNNSPPAWDWRRRLCGGIPRTIGEATVYDKDVVNTWRFGGGTVRAYEVFFWEKALEYAVGQDVLGVCVDGWEGSEEGTGAENMTSIEILRKFGDYISGLGTQPVTLPIRGLALAMADSYRTVDESESIEPFSWATNAFLSVLETFIRSQEIFFYPSGREPVMEVTFSILKWAPDDLDVEFAITWNPVLAHFEGLNNAITEGKDFSIKPTFKEPHNLPPEESQIAAVPTTASFSDDIRGCLVGRAPEVLAGICGAEKLETYNVALEFTGTLSKHFPGEVRLEKCVRCVVPLTIKRAKSRCGWESEMVASPPLPASVTAGQNGRGTFLGRHSMRVRERGERHRAVFGTVKASPLSRKENVNLSNEETYKLLERKAAEPIVNPVASPTRLKDPLSLARYHDAVGFQRPPLEMRTFEVRTVMSSTQSPKSPLSPHRSPLDDLFRTTQELRERFRPRTVRLPIRQHSPKKRDRQVRGRIPAEHFDEWETESPDTKAKPYDDAGISPRTGIDGHSLARTRPPLVQARNFSSLDGKVKASETPWWSCFPVQHCEALCAESPIAGPSKEQHSRASPSEKEQVSPKSRSKPAWLKGLECIDSFDGSSACTDLEAARDTGALRLPSPKSSLNQAIQNWRGSLRHGPVGKEREPTFDEQKRAVDERFAKQKALYDVQLQRTKRFGCGLDVNAILAGKERVDDLDPRDQGPKDAKAKLPERDVEDGEGSVAEQLKVIMGTELAELVIRAQATEREKCSCPEDTRMKARQQPEDVYVDPDCWQRKIQANHLELNERKASAEGKQRAREDEEENENLKLDITMVDAVDSDEVEEFEEGSSGTNIDRAE